MHLEEMLAAAATLAATASINSARVYSDRGGDSDGDSDSETERCRDTDRDRQT